ncbi:MAG: hypothetical protein JJT89_04725 [Nitriliruptoraceae bacterium]|nr:hypothetical protein [Nitriliruptoraceae bacterium]
MPTNDGRRRPRLPGAVASPRVALAALALLTVAAAGCSGDDVRDDEGTVVNAGNSSVYELRPGDCLDPPPTLTGEVEELPVVPCTEEHTQEVFALVSAEGDVYPGPAEVAAIADRECLDALQDGFGLSPADGVYFSYLLPTFDGWNTRDDRQIVCVLVFPDLGPVTGSVVAGTLPIEPRTPAPPAEPDLEAPDGDEDTTDPDDTDDEGSAAPSTGGGDR